MEISKESAAKYLRNVGYEAEVIKGVVTVYVSEDTCIGLECGKILRKVRRSLASAGYTGSVGVKIKGNRHEKTDDGGIRDGAAGREGDD